MDIVSISGYSPACRSLWNENQFVNLLRKNQLVHVHCLEGIKVSCNQCALVSVLTTKQPKFDKVLLPGVSYFKPDTMHDSSYNV